MVAEILEGENLIWEGRPTWKWTVSFMLKWGLVGLVPFAVGLVLARYNNIGVTPFLGISVILIAGVVLLAWVRRLDTHYTVTDRRLIVRHGILNRNERSASLDRIQNVNTGQGFYGRILNFGDIEFDTAGSDSGDSELALRGVNDPHKLRDILDAEVFARGRTSGL